MTSHVVDFGPLPLQDPTCSPTTTHIEIRETFALHFPSRMEVDVVWPWSILCTDEAHIYLNSQVSVHNCHIWAKANPHAINEGTCNVSI
ncbi:hypothetical protein AVEN_159805-1 [Araneus ventricosus]|uniref:Uncharacterized protein n=1 Tax=Araneus ventricosus TaxID=182803 RepID=A0A4Y2R4D1_ARAVE|nr:hypothetical protein AVEN_5877-1 [Araneus ventricosus]GBN70573.1 hypothetical protein AVEN_159805-1 [Araneus ventricosus]